MKLEFKTGKCLWLLIFFFVAGVPRQTATATDDLDKAEFFENKIRPVLVEYCYECHSSESKTVKGELRVDSRQWIQKGGESGPAVVPKDTKSSLLLDALRHESFEMPPDKKLPAAIIRDFEKWISDGAYDPRDEEAHSTKEEIDLEKGREFWAFRPIEAPPIPNVKSDWPTTDIDRFVLQRLQQESLSPNPHASKEVLIRRLHMDLIGLPPTPNQIQNFRADHSPNAYSKLVDELLASEHFGERWGRHWLDVARYADSSGGGRILLFQDAWRYRDYVIDSFNNDLPIDRFFTEQLAGDLLNDEPNRKNRSVTATGFLMLGAHNYELQDKELLRMEVVDEQINVVGKSMLGMTITCARCHDHKFDPIPTNDYYALAGIFRSSKSLVPGNVSGFTQTELFENADVEKGWKTYQQQRKKLDQEIAALKKGSVNLTRVDPRSLQGIVVDDTAARFTGQWTASVAIKPFLGSGYQHSSIPNTKATFEIKIPEKGEYLIRLAYTPGANRTANARVTLKSNNLDVEKRVNQQVPPKGSPFTDLGQFKLKGDSMVEVTVHSAGDAVTIADGVQAVLVSEFNKSAGSKKRQKEKLSQLNAKKISELQSQLKKLAKNQPPAPSKVMSIVDHPSPKEIGDYFVCIRGNVHRLGEKVKRSGLSVIKSSSQIRIPSGTSGRRELAEWIVSSKNPLTSRVFVNRVWLKLMGAGIVSTPDNFGKMGSRPTHSLLLDHLATQFVKKGWSLKKLIRLIVHSSVYQQSSESNAKGQSQDPENHLYWKMNRRRLDVETIRDAILQFSGTLEMGYGGKSIKPNTKREFGYIFDSNRRSVYLPVFRNTLPGIFEVYDFPNPNLVSGKRTQSTLPTQALFMMNSPFVNRHSKLAAERFMKELDGKSITEQIDFLYQSALGRSPSKNEMWQIQDFLEQKGGGTNVESFQAVCHSLFSCLDFVYLK